MQLFQVLEFNPIKGKTTLINVDSIAYVSISEDGSLATVTLDGGKEVRLVPQTLFAALDQSKSTVFSYYQPGSEGGEPVTEDSNKAE